MPMDFPAFPAVGQEYIVGTVTYVYNGTGWVVKGSTADQFVVKSGDTMLGHLGLPAGPGAAQAVRKDYVDSADAAIGTSIGLKADKTYVDTQNASQDTQIGLRVLKAGDVMGGHLGLPAGPASTQAVRKDYVDAADATLQTNINAKAATTYVDTQNALRVAKTGDAMTGSLAIYLPNNPSALTVRSGDATKYVGIDVGRTGTDGIFGAAAGPSHFLPGTVAGDVALTADVGRRLHLGAGGAAGLMLDVSQVACSLTMNVGSINSTGNIVLATGAVVAPSLYVKSNSTGFGNPTGDFINFRSNNVEWLRGNYAGGTGRANAYQAMFSQSTNGLCFKTPGTSGTIGVIDFSDNALVQCGAINTDQGAHTTTFLTSSDERGKQNRAPVTAPEARAIIDALRVWDFDKDGNQIRGYGVIAQQAYEVHPSLAVKPENEDDWWLVEKAAPVPFLIAALQGANAHIDKLEERLLMVEEKLTKMGDK